MHQRLFTPGPTEVRAEMLQAMATPQIHHRSKEFSDLYAEIQVKLQKLFCRGHVQLNVNLEKRGD